MNDGELSTAESAKESEMLNEMLKGLRERDRRTVLRRVEKGESALDVMAEIVGLEIGNEVTDGDAREDGEDAGDGSAEKDGSRPENAKGSR